MDIKYIFVPEEAMADYITDDVDKDGLYKAFVKLGLVE